MQDTQQKQEDPEVLKAHLNRYELMQKSASSRKERCELLMRRKSASKWAPAKKAGLGRKLMTANNELEQAEQAIQYLRGKLNVA